MKEKGSVVTFEVPAEKPERAAAFYRHVFGWEIKKKKGRIDNWLIQTHQEQSDGEQEGILKKRNIFESSHVFYICTVGVSELDDFVFVVAKHGGSVVVPKMAISHIGWMAYCKDTEGNFFGIMQPDTLAE